MMRDDDDPPLPADDELNRLLAEIKGGSERALGQLIDTCWERLVRFATWRLGDDEDQAEDVVQEALIAVWNNRKGWRGGSARAYLYKIVRGKVIDKMRQVWRWRELVDQRAWWLACQLFPKPSRPDQELDAKELEGRVRDAFESLPPRRREVFTLVALEGLSHAETAEVMGISRQTVANQMSAALRSVRRAIGRI